MDFQEFAEKLWETMNSVGRLRVVKGLKIIPPGHLILPRCHLAQRIQGACPEPHKRGELWKALEEGSWEEVEALLLKALSRGKNPRDQRGLGNLSIYLSRKLAREPRMPETPRLQSVPKPIEASPLSSRLPSSHGLGEERRRPRISSELCSSTGAQCGTTS
jgi:hypothetical protein